MLNNKAKSFVLIMLTIAILALFLRIGIDRLVKFTITQNESQAAADIKSIAVALETYAKDNQGIYPSSLRILTQNNPPYLDDDYTKVSFLKGYNYTCPRLEASGYSCSAVPIRCKLTGRKIYIVSTGGLLISEDCQKKE